MIFFQAELTDDLEPVLDNLGIQNALPVARKCEVLLIVR